MSPEPDPQLERFIDTHVDDFTKWDLLVFFDSHRDLACTSEEIADRLGRRRQDVESALIDMATCGILKSSGRGDVATYQYSCDKKTAQLIAGFMGALESREQRLLILTRLLRLGARR